MANFTYLLQSDNLIPQATLTPTSEDADFPIENVQAEPIAQVSRTTSPSAQKTLIDFSGQVTADIFAVVNHNLTDQATITLRGGSSQDPDGSSFELAIPWATRNAWALFDAAEQWQYWSLTIDDSSNPDGVIEAGLLSLGQATQLSRNFNLGSERRRETVNQVLESEFGVIATGINLFQRTRFACSFKATSDQERIELDEFLLRLERARSGLLFIPDAAEGAAYYGRLMTDHAVVRTFQDISEISGLEFVEDSAGRSIF